MMDDLSLQLGQPGSQLAGAKRLSINTNHKQTGKTDYPVTSTANIHQSTVTKNVQTTTQLNIQMQKLQFQLCI